MAYEDIFRRVAQKYSLDWRLMVEQCFRESRFDPLAVGAASDMGLMQIVPSDVGRMGRQGRRVRSFRSREQHRCGRRLSGLDSRSIGEGWAVRSPTGCWLAYNWGIGNVLKLLQSGGGWKDVPEQRRDYAIGIILAAEANALAEQIAPGREVVHG